ncbi:MAG TPA: DUF11 domain-containing protein [Acidobacteriota bacterium]|nr:DUF11 domain-containing protein [Acidobacteriota bacterium]
MFSVGKRTVLITLLSVWALAAALTAQSQTPPMVTITGEQGGNTEGTADNPFNGEGIQLGVDIVDPDPTTYNFSGWLGSGSGDFCTPVVIIQLFETESRAPILVHPRVESGLAQITVSVTVTESPHDPVTRTRTFFVEPSPFGCTGNREIPPSAPRNTELELSRDDVVLGETIQLDAEATDPDNDPLTFRFFADTNAFPISQGRLLGEETVQGCQLGCSAQASFQTPFFPSVRFISVEVSDGETAVQTEKIPVRASVLGPLENRPFNPNPTPQNCQCGDVEVQVDAGPTEISVLGGDDQLLEGEAEGPLVGGAVVPGSFRWRIVDNGGIIGLSLADSNSLEATLMTPDVAVDAQVELELEAIFSDCGCTDTLFVNVLADPIAEADLAVATSGPATVAAEQDFTLQITVGNDGPADAEEVVLTDLLPQGSTFVEAIPSQGSCLRQSDEVLCSLGDISADDSATVQLTLRGEQAADFENVAYVFSSQALDSNIFNDASVFDTAVLEAELVESLFFAQFGDGGGLSSQIVLVNPDPDEDAVALVQVRESSGQPLLVDLNGANVNGELSVDVPARGIRILRTDGEGPLQVGSATVTSSIPINGVVIFSGPFGVAGVPNSLELTEGFTAPVENIIADGVRTGLAFQNLDPSEEVTLSLTLTDEAGTELSVASRDVPALGQVARNLDEFAWDPQPDFSNFRGLVKATSDRSIGATVIQTRPGEFATLPVIPTLSAAASLAPFVKVPVMLQAGDGSLFFAQFGDGSGLFSQILLVNREELEAENVQISLRDDDGVLLPVDLNGQLVDGELSTTVPAGGLRVLQTDSEGELSVGSVRVSSDRDLAGVILFGGPQGVAGVGSSASLSSGFFAPIETVGTDGNFTINTGLAITNLEDSQVALNLQLLNPEGEVIASDIFTLSGEGHIALFVNQVEWNENIDFDSFVGTVQVTSSGNIAATVIQQRPGQFATLPVVPRP